MVLEKLKQRKAQERERSRRRYEDDDYRRTHKERVRARYHDEGCGNTKALAAKEKPRFTEIDCPCCKRPVQAPSLEIVIDHYRVTPLEARILGAVWRGKGLPVMTERIFDSMYADDPDGGPSPARMYAAFKVALCHLRKRLEGSGISVENAGYRQGYRLVIGGN